MRGVLIAGLGTSIGIWPVAMRAGMSSAVNTAWTPGMARAAAPSMLAEAGVGVGAAHEGRVQRAGQAHVVDELAPPGQQRGVFEARDPCAEMLRAHLGLSRENDRLPAWAGRRVSAGRDGKGRVPTDRRLSALSSDIDGEYLAVAKIARSPPFPRLRPFAPPGRPVNNPNFSPTSTIMRSPSRFGTEAEAF